jgi:HD-like signal output (HDOD) protein
MRVAALFRPKKQDDLDAILDGFELPSFPRTVMEILRKLRDPKSSFTEISELIRVDPGLHVKILSVVNSAAFGIRSKITNLQYAVSMLGKSRIESIVLAHAVKENLPKVSCSHMNCREFWFVSVIRACLAQKLAALLHPAHGDFSFSAGMLQDLGRIVIAAAKPNQYEKVLNSWFKESKAQIIQLEKEVLGFDHQHVGASVARRWELPVPLVEAISAHHWLDPEEDGVPLAVRLVSIVRENEKDNGIGELRETCISVLGIPAERVDRAIQEGLEAAERIARYFV